MSRWARNQDRGAPPPEAGPQAGGDERRPRPGSQLWPVLYLKAWGLAKRTGRNRVDTPCGDPRLPVPALARRPSGSSSIRSRPSSRPRATSTFRFNVAAAAPPSRPASFRERCLAPPTPASDLHGTSGSDPWLHPLQTATLTALPGAVAGRVGQGRAGKRVGTLLPSV